MKEFWATTLAALLAGWVGLLPIGCAPTESTPALRVGYQKWGTYSILKGSRRLEAAGLHVEWFEFPSGPPLLEALNAGSLDLGHAGDSPPLFAQAAGIPFVYVAASSPSPDSSAILVRSGSSIRDAAGLRGKKVGFTKGTSGHTLVIRALEAAGLNIAEIETIYLSPADGRVAFESGSIDAWSIWDPYLAAAENSGTVRRIAGGRGLVVGREFYLASKSAAEKRSADITAFFRELTGAKDWAKDRRVEVTRLLAEQTGIAPAAVDLAESRRSRYDTVPINDELIAEQQTLADRYFELGLLAKAIDVRAAVHLESYSVKLSHSATIFLGLSCRNLKGLVQLAESHFDDGAHECLTVWSDAVAV